MSETYLPPINRQNSCIRFIKELSFASFIIAIPLRYHATILARSEPQIYREYTDIMFYASDFFLLITLIIWIIELVQDKRKITLEPDIFSYALLMLTVTSLFSTLFSVDPQLSAYNSARLLVLFFLYLFLANESFTISLFLPLCIMILLNTLPAVIQFLSQGSIGLHVLGELSLDPSMPGISIINQNGIRHLRAYGLTDHPNILGGSICLGLLLLIAHQNLTNQSLRSLQYGVFSLGALGLLFTFSRSAWITFIVSTMMAAIWLIRLNIREELRNLIWLYISTSLVILPFLWVNLPLFEVRLNLPNSKNDNPQEVQSLGERELLNKTANELFVSRPFTGVGLSALPVAMKEIYPEFPVAYQPAHFVLLDVAAETGIIGAVSYTILIFTPWLLMIYHREHLQFTPILVFSSSALLAAAILSLFDYYPWLLTPGRYLVWLILGHWANVFRNSKINND